MQLEAVPDVGWEFVEWMGDLSGSANPDTILMDNDRMVTTVFTVTPCVDVFGAGFSFEPTEPFVDDTVSFSGTVTAGSAPTYTWSFGGGSTVQTGNPIVHTFPSALTEQTYTVVMTASNNCPSQDVVSQPVTIRPRHMYLPLTMRSYGS